MWIFASRFMTGSYHDVDSKNFRSKWPDASLSARHGPGQTPAAGAIMKRANHHPDEFAGGIMATDSRRRTIQGMDNKAAKPW